MNRYGCIATLVFCLSALAQAGMQRVLEDGPGLLRMEIITPAASLVPLGQPEGPALARMRVTCGDCNGSAPGAPDLPVFSFNVLSGAAEPRLTVEILESETRKVPEGIGPVPVPLSPDRLEYRRDEDLFAKAAVLEAQVGPVRFLRGARVRNVKVPLALWSEAGMTLTLLKRLRVTVGFPDAAPRPSSEGLQGSFRAEVANPVGGAYLGGTGSAASMRKSPKRGGAAGSSAPMLGENLIRIRIGDKTPGNMDEDKVYGLAFSDAVRIAPGINGVRLGNLRLFAGPQDTLARAVGPDAVSGTLAEIPVEIRERSANNIFDDGDTLYFYGHGTGIWKRLPADAGPIRWRFSTDPYSFENFYYLDYSASGGAPGKRLESPSPATPGPAPVPPRLTSAYHYLRAEREAMTLACERETTDSATGFLWFWLWSGTCSQGARPIMLSAGQISDPETDFLKDALGAPGDSLFIGMDAYPNRTDDDFRIRLAGSSGRMEPIGRADGRGSWYVTTAPLPSDRRLRIDSVRWGGGDRRFEGYTVAYRRHLSLASAPLWIFPEVYGRMASYKVENGQGAICLRVENGAAIRKMVLDAEGSFTDSLGAEDSTGMGTRYLVYRTASVLAQGALEPETPSAGGKGLRNLETGDGREPEYLIIAPRALADQAAALKNYRNDPKRALRVRTEVAFAEDIYRQFSGGRMSPPAIRDFLRWAYLSWGGKGAGGNPLKYVLLLGSGNFDYRNIAASQMRNPPPNHIPPYEFLTEGGDGVGLASDDFYGLLDPGEEVKDNAIMELSIGRLPARSPQEARDYLAKVAEYEDPAKAGAWRGRMTFAADDGTQFGLTNNLDGISTGHTTYTDKIAQAILRNEPGVMADNVYLLDYPHNPAFHKPEANLDLLSLINQGSLAVTYVGHGSNSQWADEVLLQTNDAIARIDNKGRYPLICSFACTVGRFESLKQDGMSDRLVMARDRGAIAAVSATRESYPVPNRDLAISFFKRAFPPSATVGSADLGTSSTIGDALREAKNSNDYEEYNHNDSRYNLLGEPVLLARKPQLGVVFSRTPDTLMALDCSVIEGKVEGGSGSGFVNLKILAQSSRKSWPPPFKGALMDTQFAESRGNILFERTFPYKDHRFTAEYFIPKQISFGDTNARITAFAWDASEEREGMAAKSGLLIQGVSDGACAKDLDGKGPRILITGCEKKETGGIDFPERVKLSLPYCLEIQVEDSTGGVLTSIGPDEGTMLEIPGVMDAFHPHAGVDELNRKIYRFPLEASAIPPGPRLLKVSASDGYGNVSQRTLRMDLTMDSSLNTVSAHNAPNPMKRSGTTFFFSTVLPARSVDFADPTASVERVEFEIRVFNQSGRLVKILEKARSGETGWDGRDAWGNSQANGVYFYQVTARQGGLEKDSRPGYRTLSSKRNILVISR
ncbi:MAG: Peptidase family [Fibrobacteres bacterium]|nr:Peptidase family [Fibrobacterota bacterium]